MRTEVGVQFLKNGSANGNFDPVVSSGCKLIQAAIEN